ncbi:MAG: chromosomal replication initiator protein DnaA [Erysipelotrichaceae bacterium]|nr:chromosomal replication initiator protein DnaA [Erysipelotrichaceae bacterium]
MSSLEVYYSDLWNKVIDEIQKSGKIDKVILDSFYRTSTLVSLTDSKAILVGDSEVSKQIMMKEALLIGEFFESIDGKTVKCEVLTRSEYKKMDISVPVQKIEEPFLSQTINNNILLNYNNVLPEYRFDNFVVGASNRECHAAALGCAYDPGNIYTPLFIYGNSGLGKTHLLNAIGNFVLNSNPMKKVYYTSGTDFVEKVVNSIQNKSIDQLKKELYDIDVLLMDDIQFLAGKEKSHEIFFSLFNELVNNRKQIVITSDRHPTEIKGLEERLISRFSSGLSVGLDSPEFETAVAILRLKISNQVSDDVIIDDDVIAYLASNFSKDVRSLEGCIKRLLFYAIQFSNRDHIDMALAIETFKGQVEAPAQGQEITANLIKRVVADYYGLTKQQLISKSRTSNIANARQIAMYLCRSLIDMPFVKIGEEFGKRDHSTVMSACRKVEASLKKDTFYRQAITELESQIRSK